MKYSIYKKGQNFLHWRFIGLFGLVVFIIGLISVFLAFPTNNLIDFFENLSRTIQLFLPGRILLEVPEGAWYLALAKLLGGLIVFMIIAQVIFQFFINQYQVWRLQQKQNHIVITGFGYCGQQFALAALAEKKEVVAIELEPSEQQQAFVSQNNNLTLLSGNPSDKATLFQAAVHKAERVIFANNDNLINIQAVTNLRKILLEQPCVTQKTAHIQIDDPDFVESLKEYPHFLKEDKALKVISFNRYSLAARRLLLSYPLYQYADLRGQDRIRVAIFGFGHKGQQLALQIALNIHYKDFQTPEILVIEPNASQRGQEFLSRYSGYSQICQIDFIDFDIHKQALDIPNQAIASAFNLTEPQSFLQALEGKANNSAYGQNLTAILVCFETDYKNITAALRLRTKSQQSRFALAPIFVEMTQDLQALSVEVNQTPYFAEVVQHFGQVEQICTWQEIVEGSSDELAKFLHNAYSVRYGDSRTWANLSETYRDANRGAADHLGVKLASIGYWVADDPSNWGRSVDLTVDSEAKELMAILEHKRWNAERLLNGWKYGKVRDDRRKIHPCLVPFEELPENEKEKDRTNITDLQDFFALKLPNNVSSALSALRNKWLGKKNGKKVCKAVNIALLVSGEQQFDKQELLKRILKEYADYHITFMSSLRNQQELEFAELGLGQENIIIVQAYPYDLETDEEIEAELIKKKLELSQKAEWVIDLVPAGEKVIALSLKERELLQQRAVIYQIERADLVIFVGENPQWLKWRQGKEMIPAELSSFPETLRGSREIRIV